MIRSKSITFLAGMAVAALTALSVTACGSNNGNDATASATPPTTASGRPATVGVEDNGDLGKILVDSRGRTLYLFQKDSGTQSTCTGACATAWPPLRASGKPVVGTGATASMVATTPRSDGKSQVTYNGHPLYLFSGDQQPGDTSGQGVTAFGAPWYAVSPAGTMVSGTGSSSSSSSGGSGY